jgi:hypothetical protein
LENIAPEYLERMEELGRAPLPDEFNNYSELSERLVKR